MTHNVRMKVAVSVATVWTRPTSARPKDSPALQNPVALDAWLDSLTVDDKEDIIQANRIQTQILYGTEVIIAEEEGEWVKVLIPDQKTCKEPAGYPGWVPKKQLAELREQLTVTTWAEVISDKAILTFGDTNQESIKLSFLTKLPMIEEMKDKVMVDTPHGPGILSRSDIRIEGASTHSTQAQDENQGRRIVEHGKRFLGLPYIWGGMSSFGYDCSGFAYNMHRMQGIMIPRDASDQAHQGLSVERSALEPGDLLFFAHDHGKGHIHHVGIYIGDDQMIHAPNSDRCIELADLNMYKLKEEHCMSRRYWN